MLPLSRPIAAFLLAACAAVVHAQAPAPLVMASQDEGNTTALPIIRNNQVEGFLLIESGSNGSGTRSALDRMLGRDTGPSVGAGFTIPLDNGRRVGTSLSLETNPTVGLLCNGSAMSRSFGSLAQHCLVANLAPTPGSPLALSRPGLRAETRLEGDRSALTASLGLSRFDVDGPVALPGALAGNGGSDLMLSLNGSNFEQEDIGLLGEMKVGESGWVSIGGTLARARIVPASQLPGGVRVRNGTPARSASAAASATSAARSSAASSRSRAARRATAMSAVGVTWRAPWRARLSVGAENLASRGKNPFAPARNDDEDESSRVPYIRYEQDL